MINAPRPASPDEPVVAALHTRGAFGGFAIGCAVGVDVASRFTSSAGPGVPTPYERIVAVGVDQYPSREPGEKSAARRCPPADTPFRIDLLAFELALSSVAACSACPTTGAARREQALRLVKAAEVAPNSSASAATGVASSLEEHRDITHATNAFWWAARFPDPLLCRCRALEVA
jgi:hypothetical protein